MKFIICLLIMCFIVQKNRLNGQNLDIDITRSLNTNQNHSSIETFSTLTNSVTPVLFAAPLTILAVGKLSDDPEMAKDLTTFLGTAMISGISTLALKNSIHRDRPFEAYPTEITKESTGGSSSFPSGHTSAAFSTATSLSLIYPKWYVIAPAMTWAGLVGYSRVYLGVHYPSDVLAGALLGSGSAILSSYINKKIWGKKKAKRALEYY